MGKWLLSNADPLFITAIRMLLSSFILGIYWKIKHKKFPKLDRKEWHAMLILGFVSIYLCNAFEFWGLKHLTAAKTCFLYSLSPFFTAILSYLHFNELITPKKWLGIGIGFLGTLPVLYSQSTGSLNLFSSNSIAELYVLGAVIFSVYGWILIRYLVSKRTIPTPVINCITMLIGGTFALVHSFYSEGILPIHTTETGSFASMLIMFTLLSNIICYNLYGYLLKKFTASLISFVGLLSPIFASLSAWVFINESPSPLIFLSTVIVMIGLGVFYKEELQLGYVDSKRTN